MDSPLGLVAADTRSCRSRGSVQWGSARAKGCARRNSDQDGDEADISHVPFLLTCLHEWRVLSARRPGALARPNVSPHVFQPAFSRSRNSRACHPGNRADSQATVGAEKRSSTLRRTCIFCCRRLVGVLVVCCCGLLDYGITARVTATAVPNNRPKGRGTSPPGPLYNNNNSASLLRQGCARSE